MTAWVAGLGALLLLAAAATFLVVRWDALGTTARIAVVGSVTAVAVLGGDRLRRSLPVVGAVVFHLGALLLPVDALGLAIQFEAPGWARWLIVGVTAVTTLPALAVVGRAPWLGMVALTGIPVAATGIAMAGGPSPALIVVLVGAALVPLAGRRSPVGLDWLARYGSVLVPAVAVAAGVAVDLLATLPLQGLSSTAAAAGWLAPWTVRAAVAVLATATLAVRARSGEPWLLGCVIATAGLALVHVILPEATPRAVRLWTPALAWVGVEAGATMIARTTSGARALHVATFVGRLLAVPVAFGVLELVLGPTGVVPVDHVLAGLLTLVATAWLVAASSLQREAATHQPGRTAWVGSLLAVLAAWHVSLALVLLSGRLREAILLAAMLAFVPLRPLVSGRGRRAGVEVAARGVATTLLLLLAAAGFTDGGSAAFWLALAAPVAVLPQLPALVARDDREVPVVTAVVAVVLLLGVGSLAATGAEALGQPAGLAGLLTGLTALAVSLVGRDSMLVAEGGRIVAAGAGLVTVVPLSWWWPDAGAIVTVPESLTWVGLGVDAILPAGVFGLLLVVEALRRPTGVSITAATVAALRAFSASALALGVAVEVVGAILVLIAVGSAVLAAVGPRLLPLGGRWVPGVLAIMTGPVGWILLGDAVLLRSWASLGAGLLTLAVGLATRRWPLAHGGSAVATLGTWSLLAGLESTALDLWLLPVGVQLLLAGHVVRRHVGASSWLTYAPPVALVGVPAVLERLMGGAGWHGVLAGTIGVGAVVVGAGYGLRGPMTVGGGLVVAVVLIETFAVIAGLPTWVWLTIGGVVLLLTAAVLERADGSPETIARRLAAGLRDRPS
ncbi:MAG: hypothetical protein WD638_08690 [Nitriliruptoraceae bacterium]